MMKIAIGADHGGYGLKSQIIEQLGEQSEVELIDVGCDSGQSVDYPDYAEKVCQLVINEHADYGILVCGSGIGMSMAANRHLTIRAALCHDEYTARMSRLHNNANVLCIGERVTGSGVAAAIISTWLTTAYEGGRHQQRIDKFSS